MNNADFMMFYSKYRGFSKMLIRKVVSDKHDVEELCQEVFANIYSMGKELDLSNERMVYGMVKTITLNEVKDYCKRAYKKHEYIIEDPGQTIRDLSYEIDDLLLARETGHEISLIFQKLRNENERNYEVYVRTIIYKIPPASVAKQFHTTSNNINNIVMRTRNWLKNEYAKSYGVQ